MASSTRSSSSARQGCAGLRPSTSSKASTTQPSRSKDHRKRGSGDAGRQGGRDARLAPVEGAGGGVGPGADGLEEDPPAGGGAQPGGDAGGEPAALGRGRDHRSAEAGGDVPPHAVREVIPQEPHAFGRRGR